MKKMFDFFDGNKCNKLIYTYRKLIKYFLVETKDTEITVPDVKELQDAKWYTQEEALKVIGYDNAKDIFIEGLNKLGSR